jgi:Uma2 family endonuclease
MSDMALEYKLRAFTAEEYRRLADIGLLRPEERVELLDGAIVEMSPIGENHWGRHLRIVEYLIHALGERAAIAGQASLRLGNRDEPQPDIAILARRRYNASHPPSPAEVYAVIELADTSLQKDVGPKLRLYARHGIADYLVVDLTGDVLLHYHEPHELGYQRCERLGDGDAFVLAALPSIRLEAKAFLEVGVPG